MEIVVLERAARASTRHLSTLPARLPDPDSAMGWTLAFLGTIGAGGIITSLIIWGGILALDAVLGVAR